MRHTTIPYFITLIVILLTRDTLASLCPPEHYDKEWTFYQDKMECDRTTPFKEDLCQYDIAKPTTVTCLLDPVALVTDKLTARPWSFQCTSNSNWRLDIRVVCPEGSDPCINYSDQCRITYDMSSGSVVLFLIVPLVVIGLFCIFMSIMALLVAHMCNYDVYGVMKTGGSILKRKKK
jgi:hypothetical protein